MDPWVWKIPWRKAWQPIPVFLPGKYHGQRSLAGYSPRGGKESHDLVTKQQELNILASILKTSFDITILLYFPWYSM